MAAKRQSAQIADNLGIVLSQSAAYEKYAASIGKAVDELSDEEKQIAFLNELLESGNTLLEQAGGSTEAVTDDYGRLRANIANVTAHLKEQVDEGFRPLVGVLADVTEGMVEQREEADQIWKYFRMNAESAHWYGYSLDELNQKIAEHNLRMQAPSSGPAMYELERQAADRARESAARFGEQARANAGALDRQAALDYTAS